MREWIDYHGKSKKKKNMKGPILNVRRLVNYVWKAKRPSASITCDDGHAIEYISSWWHLYGNLSLLIFCHALLATLQRTHSHTYFYFFLRKLISKLPIVTILYHYVSHSRKKLIKTFACTIFTMIRDSLRQQAVTQTLLFSY